MENQLKISVFGATGKVGKELLPFLSQASIPTIAITRHRSKVNKISFVDWIEANMADKDSLYKTMATSKAVFLASSPSENYVQEQNNVIDVAKEIGVEHIVKLSSPGATKDSPFPITRLHYEIEELLKASTLNWTILQPNSFMQNWLSSFAKTVKEERKIYEAAGDGKKPFIDARDIAEVAFRILTNPGKHVNKTYVLTGGEAVNYTQVADAVGKAIGEKVDYMSLTSDEARQRMEQQGTPQWAIQTFLAISEGQRNGKAGFVTDTVQEILNKPPRSIDTFTADYAGWFK